MRGVLHVTRKRGGTKERPRLPDTCSVTSDRSRLDFEVMKTDGNQAGYRIEVMLPESQKPIAGIRHFQGGDLVEFRRVVEADQWKDHGFFVVVDPSEVFNIDGL